MQAIPAEIEFWMRWLCAAGVLYIAVQDLRHFRIPDHATGPLALLGFVRAALVMPERLIELLAAALIAGTIFWGLAAGYKRLRGHDGLGMGDIKLAALMGLWLGADTAQAVAVGCGLGLVVLSLFALLGRRRWDAPLPLGVFLGLGFCLLLLAGPWQITVA